MARQTVTRRVLKTSLVSAWRLHLALRARSFAPEYHLAGPMMRTTDCAQYIDAR
eukprot:CAMPEP_0180685398 /NCGR_PEP_ID=MMETSP1037_2-20121125/72376_1 /TAXON_ID=632150 /ORGANISM="Azadinium spinosum, Strain 3D9" /LENGTH=53 /DNA_ID=CAMNT_0022716069 /DNA_START=77 /DNA_END=234 /DNA_ORIENTATION=-